MAGGKTDRNKNGSEERRDHAHGGQFRSGSRARSALLRAATCGSAGSRQRAQRVSLAQDERGRGTASGRVRPHDANAPSAGCRGATPYEMKWNPARERRTSSSVVCSSWRRRTPKWTAEWVAIRAQTLAEVAESSRKRRRLLSEFVCRLSRSETGARSDDETT